MQLEVISETITKDYREKDVVGVRGEFRVRWFEDVREPSHYFTLAVEVRKIAGQWEDVKVEFKDVVIPEILLDRMIKLVNSCIRKVKKEAGLLRRRC